MSVGFLQTGATSLISVFAEGVGRHYADRWKRYRPIGCGETASSSGALRPAHLAGYLSTHELGGGVISWGTSGGGRVAFRQNSKWAEAESANCWWEKLV